MRIHEKPARGPDNAKDLWILGAGFSKHVYPDLPLMTELAESVKDITAERFSNPLVLNDVELALSELGSDAPWKTSAEKHQDLALYEQVLERLQERLRIPFGGLDSDEGNISLGKRLVNAWHINRNHVITLNYDLLVESLLDFVRQANFREEEDDKAYTVPDRHIYPIPIPSVRTRNSRSVGGSESEITFSYYKLHGSLNYYTPRAPFQNTAMYHRDHVETEGLAEGLQSFLVPPTYDKQAFIEHPLLYSIWTKAADELSNIDEGRIIFIGYSLPQTDLTMLSMLRSTLRSGSHGGIVLPEVIVVNPDPEAARNYKRLLGVANRVGKVTDVTAFLEQYAPQGFVRTHVWDNRHSRDTQEQHQIYLDAGGNFTKDHFRRVEKLREEWQQRGRLGWEWFLSMDEFRNWRISTLKDAPIDEWL